MFCHLHRITQHFCQLQITAQTVHQARIFIQLETHLDPSGYFCFISNFLHALYFLGAKI
jgi:hypothetical protein